MIQADHQNETLYQELKNEYKTYRVVLRKSIREAKRLYHIRIFNTFKHDIKRTWSLINSSLNRNLRQCTKTEFCINNQIVTNAEDIANGFNDYFINIGSSLSNQIQSTTHYDTYLQNPAITRFSFHPINENDIRHIISKLKNKASYGHDYISNNLLKRMQDIIIKPLTILINQTLLTSYFPEQLKISKVKPLFKTGDSAQLSNYRPISLLPSISKVYEYVLFNQLFNYMNTNNLLSINQFGFRPSHSTELAGLKLMDHITKQMDNGKVPINIYIDLSKAFDTLNHTILLSKLNYYGIRGLENDLFRQYLTNRYQFVEFHGKSSNKQIITTGVPQGSIMGPLLFLIYINDLPLISQIFNMMMYADDTTLYCNLSDTSEVLINSEINRICEWLSANKLSLNTKKTKFMVFHVPQRQVIYPRLKINNIEIERVNHFNFLGIIFYSTLKWNNHIQHISIKISRIVGLMWRLKTLYPMAVLRLLYNSLVLPHLTYGILIWGTNIKHDHPLHRIQKRGLRTISNQSYIAHSEPICKELNLIKLPDMYHIALWKFYFKLMNNTLPEYFNGMKPILPLICNRYPLRKSLFHLPKIKHKFAEHLLEYQLVKKLNEEGSIRYTSKIFTHSFMGFKLYLKNTTVDTYSNNCTMVNCRSCELNVV